MKLTFPNDSFAEPAILTNKQKNCVKKTLNIQKHFRDQIKRNFVVCRGSFNCVLFPNGKFRMHAASP